MRLFLAVFYTIVMVVDLFLVYLFSDEAKFGRKYSRRLSVAYAALAVGMSVAAAFSWEAVLGG